MFLADALPPPLLEHDVIVVGQVGAGKGISDKITNPNGKKQERTMAITRCSDVANYPSAHNTLWVTHSLWVPLGYKWDAKKGASQMTQSIFAQIATNATIVHAPSHGKVRLQDGPYPYWRYESDPEFIGKDKVSFVASANGRRVTLTINLLVREVVDERDDGNQACDFEKF